MLAEEKSKWRLTGDNRLLVCLDMGARSGGFVSKQATPDIDVSLITSAWRAPGFHDNQDDYIMNVTSSDYFVYK